MTKIIEKEAAFGPFFVKKEERSESKQMNLHAVIELVCYDSCDSIKYKLHGGKLICLLPSRSTIVIRLWIHRHLHVQLLLGPVP